MEYLNPTETTSLLEQGTIGNVKASLKIAIIGGGVSGITAARIFKTQGLDFELFEESDSLSGVWSKGYPNFAIQTPGRLYEFPDKELPAPKDFKDGPSIQKYCEDYVIENGLKKYIQLNSRVISLDRDTKSENWKVTIKSNGVTSSRVFDFVVLATGIYSPNLKHVPEVKGIQFFKGNVYHSEDTENIAGDRKDKRVVVVGFGKSAQDCAMNAYTESGGEPPILLFRKSHWCVPRKVLGFIPMEWLLYSRFGQGTLPPWQTSGPVESFFHTYLKPLIWLYWRIVETILTLQLGLYGTSSHLRPSMAIEDDMYCGHGVICHPDFFLWCHENKIKSINTSIDRILPDGKILLSNAKVIEADEIVFATGFKREFSFLPSELLERKEEDGFYSYRNMLVPGVPGIAFLNSNATTFSNITTPTLQGAWLAELLNGNIALPEDMADQVEEEKQWRRNKLKFATGDSRAYMIQLHQIRYWDRLLMDIGANVKRKKSGYGPVVDAFMNFFVPVYSSDYKSITTGEWKENGEEGRSSFVVDWLLFVSTVGLLVVFIC